MTLSIKNSGSWVTPQKIFVKTYGAWTEVKTGYIKSGGIWKPFYVSGPSADLGEHWTLLTNLALNGYYLFRFLVRHANSKWIIKGQNSSGAALIYSENNGTVWNVCSGIPNATQTTIHDMKYINESIGTIVCGYYGTTSGSSKIWRTVDGITFTEVFSESCITSQNMKGVSTIVYNGSKVFAFVNNSSATTSGVKIISSTDGINWTLSTEVSPFYENRAKGSFYNGSRIGFFYRESSGGVIRMIYSDNGGSTWSKLNLISSIKYVNNVNANTNNGTIIMSALPTSGVDDAIYVSSNNGNTFVSKLSYPNTDSMQGSIIHIPQTNRWVINNNNTTDSLYGVFYSDDNGNSWSGMGITGDAIIGAGPSYAIAYDGTSTLLATTNSGLYYSTN